MLVFSVWLGMGVTLYSITIYTIERVEDTAL